MSLCETENSSCFENPTESLNESYDDEEYIVHYKLSSVDLVYGLTVSPLLTIAYCFILYIFAKHPKEFNNPYFQLIKALAFADFLQIIDMLTFIFAAAFLDVDHTVGVIIDLLPLTLGYYGSFFLNLFIAVNRFVAIVFFSQYKRLMTKRLHNIFILLSFLLSFLCFAPFYILCIIEQKSSGERIRFSFYTTGLDGCISLLDAYAIVDYIVTMGSISCIALLYILAALAMVQKRKSIKTNTSYAREAKLMFQGILLFCLIGFIMLFDYVIDADYYILVCMYCTVNPVIYVLCDNVIRKYVRVYIKRMKSKIFNTGESDVVAISITDKSTQQSITTLRPSSNV